MIDIVFGATIYYFVGWLARRKGFVGSLPRALAVAAFFVGTLLGGFLYDVFSGDVGWMPSPNTPANEHTILVTAINITITPIRRLYTLTAIWPLASGFDTNASAFNDAQKSPCFTLTSFDEHTSGCLDNVSTATEAPPSAPAPAPASSAK